MSNRPALPAAAGLVAVALALLSACATTRGSVQPAVVESAAQSAPEAAPTDTTAVAGDSQIQTPTTDNEGVAPPCLPEPKAKPKPKPKPRPVRKEVPSQPQTPPVVTEAPVSTSIDAQVKPINMSVMSILGKKVQGAKGEDLGRVVDVLADNTGRVRVAIIDFGGFLGVGNHRIAVDWPLLRFNPDAQEPSLLLSVSSEKLQTAPEYKDTAHPQMLMSPTAEGKK